MISPGKKHRYRAFHLVLYEQLVNQSADGGYGPDVTARQPIPKCFTPTDRVDLESHMKSILLGNYSR
jgi:hypothetical protein